jgi:uncharacterized integral membrane protein
MGAGSLVLLVLGAAYYFIKFDHASIYSFWNLQEFHQPIIHILVLLMVVGAFVYFVGLIASLMSIASETRRRW